MAARHKLTQLRIAADMLKCGTSRVWMDQAAAAKISAAITRADVRRLIAAGAIRKLPAEHKGAAGKRRYQRAGSRKGGAAARSGGPKTRWLKIVRPQRALLSELKPGLTPLAYRRVYRMIKGGAFRSRAHLAAYIETSGYTKKAKVAKVKS